MLYLVVLYNDTQEEIRFRNIETERDDQIVGPLSMFRTKFHFDIPDCSAKKYFDDRHMEIRDNGGKVLFSFWGDDVNNWDLYYCDGLQYADRKLMPGTASKGVNYRNVGIVVSRVNGKHSILGRPVANNV